MSLLYKRIAAVTVTNSPVQAATPAIDSSLAGAPVRVLPLPTSTQIRVATPLRVQFKVEKDLFGATPNTADISITNLAESTRKRMQQFGAQVVLEAGYESDGLSVVFRGTARTIDHIRQGAEWITRIQCGDGEAAHRYAQATFGYVAGTPTVTVARDLAAQLQLSGVDTGAFIARLDRGDLKFSLNPSFVAGYAVDGNVLDELETLTQAEFWSISVQNGALVVLNPFGVNSVVEQLINESTGMIGSPEHCAPDKTGMASMLKVRSLLLPKFNPGDWFVLDAQANKGNFRGEKVGQSGDTHGTGDESWTTTIEARPLPQRPQ